MDILNFMLVPFTQPALFLLTGAGVLVGIYVGAIPGLSVTMAVSLLFLLRIHGN
jgi:putative tricarboxylic transport membrane protein